MSKSTLSRIYKRYREGKGFTSAPRGGPRKTSKRTDRKLLIQVKRTPKMPLRELQQNVVPEISKRTINRRLAESDIKKWLAAERPLLEKEHAAQRLEWALKHKDWTEEDWLKVDWSDECSVERSEGEANVWVFRTRYQKFGKKIVKEKRKSALVFQMMWACFAGNKKGPCIGARGDPESKRGGVSSRSYLYILDNYLLGFHQDNWIFMQDNARIHTAYKLLIGSKTRRLRS